MKLQLQLHVLEFLQLPWKKVQVELQGSVAVNHFENAAIQITLRRFVLEHVTPQLGCRRWGFKRWGQANPSISEEKDLFPALSGFPRCFSDPPEKGENSENGKKGQKRPISRKGGQTPLKPPFVAPYLRQPNAEVSGKYHGWGQDMPFLGGGVSML